MNKKLYNHNNCCISVHRGERWAATSMQAINNISNTEFIINRIHIVKHYIKTFNAKKSVLITHCAIIRVYGLKNKLFFFLLT